MKKHRDSIKEKFFSSSSDTDTILSDSEVEIEPCDLNE